MLRTSRTREKAPVPMVSWFSKSVMRYKICSGRRSFFSDSPRSSLPRVDMLAQPQRRAGSPNRCEALDGEGEGAALLTRS